MAEALIPFLLFTAALLAAGYYVWSVPQQHASEALAGRLRELRSQTRAGARAASDLIQREHRGSFAFLGDFFAWLGVMRRLQTYIVQANLKYRAADVVGLSVVFAAACFPFFVSFGMKLLGSWLRLVLVLSRVGIAHV